MKTNNQHQIEESRKNRIRRLAGELCYVVNSMDIEYDIGRIRQERISRIQLSVVGGYELSHFDWIDSISNQITSLSISPRYDAVFDYSALLKCKNIKHLYCNNNTKSEIDVSRNKAITNATFFNMKKVHGVEELISLESLTMVRPRNDMLDKKFYMKLTSLRRLELDTAALPAGFRFLENTSIQYLKLYSCRPLSAKGLDEIALKELSVERCKEMSDIEHLYRCERLERCSIVDSFCLETIEPFIKMPRLQRLIVLGRSYFINGNLDAAEGRFEYLGIDNKRHYSKKHEDFQK